MLLRIGNSKTALNFQRVWGKPVGVLILFWPLRRVEVNFESAVSGQSSGRRYGASPRRGQSKSPAVGAAVKIRNLLEVGY
jgi:hypothetical protein